MRMAPPSYLRLASDSLTLIQTIRNKCHCQSGKLRKLESNRSCISSNRVLLETRGNWHKNDSATQAIFFSFAGKSLQKTSSEIILCLFIYFYQEQCIANIRQRCRKFSLFYQTSHLNSKAQQTLIKIQLLPRVSVTELRLIGALLVRWSKLH